MIAKFTCLLIVCGKTWEIGNILKMSDSFFSGCQTAKLDEKNRFVLPQSFRYQLVERGELSFTLGLSMGGCLAIYKKSDIQEIVERFRKKRHIAKFQKFFTLFFSTLVETTCDKVGRVTIPNVLKEGVGIKNEIILAGALDKIEIWPKEVYENDLTNFIGGSQTNEMQTMMEEAFMLLATEDESEDLEAKIGKVQQEVVKL